MMLVQFGAGNIGRSFIGQLFAGAGWEVVFIDIDERIIDSLNARGQYVVEIRDRVPASLLVTNVRGIHGRDLEAVSLAVSEADLVATAVGKKALPHIMLPIATGLMKRLKRRPSRPLDIIICENMREGALVFSQGLRQHLSPDYPFTETVGLVETSIGKMVPIMSEQDRAQDPLLVYAEAYNTLIVDRNGFRGTVPAVPGLKAKDSIAAYVDRKLFIHNMGHAVLGYVSYVFRPQYRFVWEAAQDTDLLYITKRAMWESGNALLKVYPDEFGEEDIGEHIEDLLLRFQNVALGDTIFRVGRDLYRKLGHDDRLAGAISLCMGNGILPKHIVLALACAFFFRAVDEDGRPFESDAEFQEKEVSRGVDHLLKNICGIEEEKIHTLIRGYFLNLESGNRDLQDYLSL
jgi:mannitol-1-phosphate 5-dehydrogenase